MTRAEAFERFKAALAAADLSPSDRYRIHVAGCEYAGAAAQEMLTKYDEALRRELEPKQALPSLHVVAGSLDHLTTGGR